MSVNKKVSLLRDDLRLLIMNVHPGQMVFSITLDVAEELPAVTLIETNVIGNQIYR